MGSREGLHVGLQGQVPGVKSTLKGTPWARPVSAAEKDTVCVCSVGGRLGFTLWAPRSSATLGSSSGFRDDLRQTQPRPGSHTRKQ